MNKVPEPNIIVFLFLSSTRSVLYLFLCVSDVLDKYKITHLLCGPSIQFLLSILLILVYVGSHHYINYLFVHVCVCVCTAHPTTVSRPIRTRDSIFFSSYLFLFSQSFIACSGFSKWIAIGMMAGDWKPICHYVFPLCSIYIVIIGLPVAYRPNQWDCACAVRCVLNDLPWYGNKTGQTTDLIIIMSETCGIEYATEKLRYRIGCIWCQWHAVTGLAH